MNYEIPEGERDLKIVVWENIEMYRTKKKYSQREFCKMTDYDYKQYEVGKRIGKSLQFQTLQRFAYYLGIKTIDLFEDWSEG